MGRGVWLPASLQENMDAEDVQNVIESQHFKEEADYWKGINGEALYPEGGWGTEPGMHEDRSMQIKKSGVPLNVS